MVAIAFMFILLVIAAVLVHGFMLTSLHAAADRRSELKVEHVRETLQRTTVDPYQIPALEAAAQQLVLAEPIVDNNYLSSWMRNVLEYFSPPGCGIGVRLSLGEKSWRLSWPDNANMGREFTSRGNVTVIETGGGIVSVEVEIKIFEIRS